MTDLPARKYLERGTTIGRYVVLDRLGEGGMGVVYRAFDPELDRMVALKLLHTRSQTGTTIGDPAWLLREAQAMARLSHPNVVIVHDVGVVSEDQVFVAMELVDGTTLRAWLAQQRHSWREVRDVMLAAGAGLAAAHHAKLVHRDFKTENVIVGKDGRVRVMDFGLASTRRGDTIPPPGDHDPLVPTANDLTVVDGVIGTPAYMAPELFDGDSADARSDQFSFGVVLYEALAGKRPYAKELVPTKDSPPPAIPATVPARVGDVALRAIAIDPAKRFSSMDELLSALAVDPTAPRRRIAIGLGAIVTVAAVVVATRLVSPHAAAPCQGIETRLTGVWDAPTKAKIQTAYLATKLPYAAKAYAALAPALDRYSQAWVDMSTESCKATRVRRDQTEDVLTLRQACLDQQLVELGALTKLLAEPNQLVVVKAADVVEELDKVSRCANVRVLRAPTAPPPEVAPKLPEIRQLLAEAKADTIVSRGFPAGVAADKAVALAKAAGFPPILAEAMTIQGGVQRANNNPIAVATLTDAAWLAETAQRDDLVAKTGVALANLAIEAQPPKPGEARVWLGLGQAAARRLGLDHVFESDFKLIEAVLDIQEGNVTAAVAAGEASFAASEKEYGKDSGVLFGHEILFAGTLARALQYAKAAPHYEHALTVRAQLVGEAYPEVALTLSNLAVCYHFMGELDKARTTFARALKLREMLFGAASPVLVPTLDNYGVFLTQTDDPAKGRAMLERALALAAGIPGKDSPDYHVVATDHADAVVAEGKLAEAHALFDELLARETALHSTTLPMTQTSRAQLALAEGRPAEAASFAELAIAGFESAGGKDNPELWRPLAALGRALAALGKPADAREALERSLAIGTAVQLAPAQLQPARAALAKL